MPNGVINTNRNTSSLLALNILQCLSQEKKMTRQMGTNTSYEIYKKHEMFREIETDHLCGHNTLAF